MPNVRSARFAVETAKAIQNLLQKKFELLQAGRLAEAEILKKEISVNIEKYNMFTEASKIFSKQSLVWEIE